MTTFNAYQEDQYDSNLLILCLCHAFTYISHAKLLAGFFRRKPVPVAQAPSVDERQATPRITVKVPLIVFALAWALVLPEEADRGSARLHADLLAFFFLVKVVASCVAAAVPEPAAAAVVDVVEPLRLVVGALTCFGRLGANVSGVGGSAAL